MSDYSLLILGMTLKKDNIISVALELFAKYGYANTSTSKISKQAGVSEGLIFRHFVNKEGLLDAIVSVGTASFEVYFEKMKNEPSAKQRVLLAIDFPLTIMNENKDYWNLVTSLKYQSPEISKKYHNSEIFNQFEELLISSFTALGLECPELETKYLILTITGLSGLLKQNDNQEEIKELINFIKNKYQF